MYHSTNPLQGQGGQDQGCALYSDMATEENRSQGKQPAEKGVKHTDVEQDGLGINVHGGRARASSVWSYCVVVATLMRCSRLGQLWRVRTRSEGGDGR